MNFKIASTLTAFLLPFNLLAQVQKSPGEIFFTKPSRNAANVASKSTATASRLIAAAGGEYDANSSAFIFIDSVFVSYSGERGGDMNSEYIKYDNGTRWIDNGGGLQEAEKLTQVFDGNDNILSTLIQEWDGVAWVNSYGLAYTYDGYNNILSETELEWNSGNNAWDSLYRYMYVYDVNHVLISETGIENTGSAWQNSYQYAHTPDMNGNIIFSALSYWNIGNSVWDSFGKQHFTFNTDDLVVESWDESWQVNTWQKHSKYLTTYNTSDLPHTITRQSWDGSNWVTARIVTNTYVNNDLVNVLEQYGNGDNLTNQDYTFDGNHNRLSSVDQHWFNNAWVNDRKMEWTYNSFNQMLTDKMFRWINNAWGHTDGDLTNRYYYETYTAGIEDKTRNTEIKVYPVPARNFVKVGMAWSEPQAFNVSILDMSGRLVRSYGEKACSQYSRTIDVNQLPSGNYIIKIAGMKGKAMYQQFSVVR